MAFIVLTNRCILSFTCGAAVSEDAPHPGDKTREFRRTETVGLVAYLSWGSGRVQAGESFSRSRTDLG